MKSKKALELRQQEKLNELRGILPARTRSENDSCVTYTGIPQIDDLLDLPADALDSLYNEYKDPAYEEYQENLENSIIELLIENSSEDEVQKLINFRNDYMAMGGHNLDYLEEATLGVSPLIKDCMIGVAATVDEYMESPFDPSSPESCLDQLIANFIDTQIKEGIKITIESTIPEIGLVLDLVEVGYDLYRSLEIVYHYQQCTMIQGNRNRP